MFLRAARKGSHYPMQAPAGLQNFQLNRRKGHRPNPPAQGLRRAPLAQAVRALLRCPESTCLIPLGFSAGRGTTGPRVGPSCQHHALVVLLGHKPPLTTLFFTTIFVLFLFLPSQVISFPLMEKSCNKVAEIPSA